MTGETADDDDDDVLSRCKRADAGLEEIWISRERVVVGTGFLRGGGSVVVVVDNSDLMIRVQHSPANLCLCVSCEFS